VSAVTVSSASSAMSDTRTGVAAMQKFALPVREHQHLASFMPRDPQELVGAERLRHEHPSPATICEPIHGLTMADPISAVNVHMHEPPAERSFRRVVLTSRSRVVTLRVGNR
jgi:hypothetical protein